MERKRKGGKEKGKEGERERRVKVAGLYGTVQ